MAPLNPQDVRACVHPRLPLRFALAIICVVLIAPLGLALSIFGAVSLILAWVIFLAWLGAEVIYAVFIGNSILVSELNYPRILGLSEEIREALSVRKTYSIFVYQEGEFNAAMIRLFFRRAIFLNSEILETGVSDDEVRWIVGRFVGYWRVQQDTGFVGWLIRMTQKTLILNALILPYERAMVYTGDRLGLAAIGGDIASAVSAMQKLLVGRLLGYSVNPVGVVEQARQVKGSLFAFLARLPSAYPHTIIRYVDLISFAKRRFPDQFARFDAANPGIPDDLDALSGERTSGISMAKMAAYVGSLILAALFTALVWAGLGSWLGKIGAQFPGQGLQPPVSSTLEPPAASEAPASEASDAAAPASDATAASAPAPAQLNDPLILRSISAADLGSAYPAQAKAAGVSGDVSVTCQVTADGAMSGCRTTAETPTGYGFGDAAVGLASQITVQPKAKDGSPVGGRPVTWDVPFKAQP